MRLQVLGGFGGESRDCRMTCLLINGSIALDAGSLSQVLSIERQVEVHSILLSHSHMDHTNSLPFFIENVYGKSERPIDIHASEAPISPLSSPAAAPAGFEPAAPAPSAPAAPANTNPEVRPPSDVDGPGWAFATTRVPISPDDAELHEQARRLARLLVSEIKLYNEDQVEEGRRNRDLYERLKEDIDRSRQMYEERVEPRVWKSTDYFYQELVRILAAGDSRALGI